MLRCAPTATALTAGQTDAGAAGFPAALHHIPPGGEKIFSGMPS